MARGAGRGRSGGPRLGFFLCWAVVFADIGTSVYYTPGILFGQVGVHAALFVTMTLVVFVLLAIKYAEVAVRYPEGGGVVTVASSALHPNVGLVGGLLILVDYFLTASLSALSGVIYLSVVAPGLQSVVLPVTVLALVALGVLNLMGVKSSARVSAIFACAAAVGQFAVVIAVIVHVGPGHLLSTFPKVLSGPRLTPVRIVTGYSGAFLAFSGLESIAQLAPAMAEPRRRVATVAMTLVVLTVALTSPLLTLWSTTLLDMRRSDPNQFISLLGTYAAGPSLGIYVALTGSLLLVFASNTALIGSYHVFLALSKMRFLPRLLRHTNRWRRTPHWAIAVATGIPLGVVLLTRGNVGLLGDLYAFGLLGAFTLTCLSLDVVRWNERKEQAPPAGSGVRPAGPLAFGLGVLTTVLVSVAWTTNLFAKPLATLFGGGLILMGLLIALANLRFERRRGRPPVFPHLHRHEHPIVLMRRGRRLPYAPVLALLPDSVDLVEGVVTAAAEAAAGRPVAFVHQGEPSGPLRAVYLLEIVDPYLEDRDAQRVFSAAERVARRLRVDSRYIYIPDGAQPGVLEWLLQALQAETTVAREHVQHPRT
jgi:amino acid transporter